MHDVYASPDTAHSVTWKLSSYNLAIALTSNPYCGMYQSINHPCETKTLSVLLKEYSLEISLAYQTSTALTSLYSRHKKILAKFSF